MTSDYIHLLLHFPPFLEPCALYAVAPLTVFHDGAAVRKKNHKRFFCCSDVAGHDDNKKFAKSSNFAL